MPRVACTPDQIANLGQIPSQVRGNNFKILGRRGAQIELTVRTFEHGLELAA